MDTTSRRIRHRTTPRVSGRAWRIGARAVGVYFGSMAVLNTVRTVRIAPDFLQWLRDNTWLPPYRPVLGALVPVAPAIILGSAAFQAAVAYQLLRGRRVSGSLRWAQAWVLGLIPALPWPYWVVNAVSAGAFEALRRDVIRNPSA